MEYWIIKTSAGFLGGENGVTDIYVDADRFDEPAAREMCEAFIAAGVRVAIPVKVSE